METRSYRNLLTDSVDHVIFLTINRTHALNALNEETMEELRVFFMEDLPSMPSFKGIIVAGAGEKAFVAGADISDFLNLDSSNIEGFVRRGHLIFNYIENLRKPVVAVVKGYALGAGLELAMACHFRVGGPKAQFGLPEVNLGIVPGYGGTQRLITLIGRSRALEMMMTGSMIDAHTALQYGLINRLADAGNEIKVAVDLIEKVHQKAPLAIAHLIQTTRAYFDRTQDGFEQEIRSFCELVTTNDFKEGAKAFLEKRSPTFKGN